MQYIQDFRRLDTGEQFPVYASESAVHHRSLGDLKGFRSGSIELFTKDGTSLTENGGRWFLVPLDSPDDIEVEPIN